MTTVPESLDREDKFFQENGPFSDPTGGYLPGDEDEEEPGLIYY